MTEKTNAESAWTGWDFEWGEDPENLTLKVIPSELGITYIGDLSEENIRRVQLWAKVQLEAVLSERYKKVKMKKREPEPTSEVDLCGQTNQVIFRTPLAVLVERDKEQYPDPRRVCNVPLILEAMMLYFTLKGGMSVGAGAFIDTLATPTAAEGTSSCCEVLARPPVITERNVILTLDRYFHRDVKYSHIALDMANISDVVYAIKCFLSHLPEPVLTNDFIDVFLQLHEVKDSMDILIIMKLLVLQMPTVNRCTLWCLLTFFAQLSARDENEELRVLRQVMTPYLLPVSETSRKEMPENLPRRLMFLMNKYRTILFTVPVDVVMALRTYDKNTDTEDENLTMTVNAPQLGIQDFEISGNAQNLSAYDVVQMVMSSVKDHYSPRECASMRKNRMPLVQLTRHWKYSGADKCSMDSSDQRLFSDCHRLYEVGGNIDERRLSHEASPFAVYRNNPDVRWEIRCDHPIGASEFARHITNDEQICDDNVINFLTNLCRSPTFDSQH